MYFILSDVLDPAYLLSAYDRFFNTSNGQISQKPKVAPPPDIANLPI